MQFSVRPVKQPSLFRQRACCLNISTRGKAVRAATSIPPPASDNARNLDDVPCPIYMTEQGESIQVMCFDYGFRTGTERLYQDRYGSVPGSLMSLATNNFQHEFMALRRSIRYNEFEAIADRAAAKGIAAKVATFLGTIATHVLAAADRKLVDMRALSEVEGVEAFDLASPQAPIAYDLRDNLKKLTLSNEGVLRRENERKASEPESDFKTPWYIQGAYNTLCAILDVIYNNRPIQRFWCLETVARMPYFSYISMLHLYESFGWWRAGADLRRIHFAEEWNELHHLQIMESLGGDMLWFDRFLAQHAALVYYWVLVVIYSISPQLAYNFSELVEQHATDTYSEFLAENEEVLKSLPPPWVAVEYYKGSDMYLFDEFQTHSVEHRRPACNSLYDVFANIRDDEIAHKDTMTACRDGSMLHK